MLIVFLDVESCQRVWVSLRIKIFMFDLSLGALASSFSCFVCVSVSFRWITHNFIGCVTFWFVFYQIIRCPFSCVLALLCGSVCISPNTSSLLLSMHFISFPLCTIVHTMPCWGAWLYQVLCNMWCRMCCIVTQLRGYPSTWFMTDSGEGVPVVCTWTHHSHLWTCLSRCVFACAATVWMLSALAMHDFVAYVLMCTVVPPIMIQSRAGFVRISCVFLPIFFAVRISTQMFWKRAALSSPHTWL